MSTHTYLNEESRWLIVASLNERYRQRPTQDTMVLIKLLEVSSAQIIVSSDSPQPVKKAA